MAQYTNGPRTFQAGSGGVGTNDLVKLSSGKAIKNTATATDDPVGVAQQSGAENDYVTVTLLNKEGTLICRAAGAITAGADVYAAADGEVQALPVGAGTYRKIGIALTAAAGANDRVEVLPYDYQATETVS